MLKFASNQCNILLVTVAARSKEGSVAVRLLRLWVRFSPGHRRLFYVFVVCCHVDVCTTHRSLV